MMDHNLISVALFVLAGVMTMIGVLIKGWFNNVNQSLSSLNEKFDAEVEARIKRWDVLHDKLEDHTGRISKLEGRLNGKSKLIDMLGVSKPHGVVE